MQRERSKLTAGLLFVLLASFGYGTMPAVTQYALASGVAIETVLASRYLFGLPLIWIYIFFRRKNVRVGRGNALFMTAAGCTTVLCAITMNESYKYIPGFIASLLVFLYVVIVVLIEILIGKEKPHKSRLLCLALAVIGLIAVVWVPDGDVSLNPIGIFFAFAAALTYALSAVIMGAKRLADISAEVVMGFMFLIPMAVSLIRAAAAGCPLVPPESPQIIFVIFLSLSAGFVAPVAFCQAIKLIGASTSSMINTSEPVIAYFAGVVIMSDRISGSSMLGGGLIIVAILLLNITERKRASSIDLK
ncbi:MAG: DMT family transporter [Clostridiales Family XIII bacterium]|nr:DMT family transporter [Clostridiales Family XIII bacterium]